MPARVVVGHHHHVTRPKLAVYNPGGNGARMLARRLCGCLTRQTMLAQHLGTVVSLAVWPCRQSPAQPALWQRT